MAPLLGEERVARTRILGYVERVVWLYDDYTFRRHFTMTKLTFNIALQVIQRYMGREDDSREGRMIAGLVDHLFQQISSCC